MRAGAPWPVVPLGELVTETQYGTAAKANEEGTGVPVLRMGNITYRGAVDLAELKHVELTRADFERYSVRRGDLLFNRTNSRDLVGKMGVWDRDEQYAFAGYLVRLRLRRDLAEPAFVAGWFNTPEMKALLRAKAKPSVNMANISASEILRFPIVRPPLAEQGRIAELLGCAEALRVKRRATLTLLDGLATSIFLELFGDAAAKSARWPMTKLSDLGEVQGGLQVTRARSGLPREVPYLRVANVYRDEVRLEEIKTIRTTASELTRTLLQPADLLVVEGHGNPHEIGRCAIWDGSISPCVHQNHLIRVRLQRDRILPDYACRHLNSASGRQHLLRAGKTTTGLNTISVSEVREVPIPLPPLALQQEFARRIAAVDRLKAAQRASLAEMDALFASLQHRAFRGEL